MFTLILNLGLKSIRAIIFDINGVKITSSALPINTYLKEMLIEQDPTEWWEKAKDVINNVTKEKTIMKNIQYISITSSSSCLVVIDKHGNPLMNSIMVSDKRAIKESDSILELGSYKELSLKYELKLNPTFLLPKILWVKNNLPDIYDKVYKFLSPNDFLLYKLTGEIATDVLNAEKFLYIEQEKTYPTKLLSDLSIDLSLLPHVIQKGEYSFKVNIPSVEKASINVPQNSNVIMSTYDAICAYYGSGGGINIACEVSGTVTSLRVLSETKVNIDGLFCQFSGIENSFLIGGSNNLGGGLIEWAKQALYLNEKYQYEIMEKEAMEVGLGANGIIFLPYLLGERAPLWDEFARGVFFGLDRSHNRGNMIRAVFESTAFSVRSIIDMLSTHNVLLDFIKVSGGLTQIRFINQLKSDIYNKEIHVCDEFETTSLGAFLLVMYRIGEISSIKDMMKFTKIREIIIPKPDNVEKYNKVFPLFSRLYDDLKDLFILHNKTFKRLNIETVEKIENL